MNLSTEMLDVTQEDPEVITLGWTNTDTNEPHYHSISLDVLAAYQEFYGIDDEAEAITAILHVFWNEDTGPDPDTGLTPFAPMYAAFFEAGTDDTQAVTDARATLRTQLNIPDPGTATVAAELTTKLGEVQTLSTRVATRRAEFRASFLPPPAFGDPVVEPVE